MVSPGGGGETTLFSIVHNTKCLEALAEIKKGKNSSSESVSQPTASEAPPTSSHHDASTLSRASGSGIDSFERGAFDRTRPLPYTNITDFANLSDYLTNLPEAVNLSHVVLNFTTPPAPELVATPTNDHPLSSGNSAPRGSGLNEPLLPATYKTPSNLAQCSCRSQKGVSGDGVDLLAPLVSNWPCLVATILGFCPSETLSTNEAREVISVHSLDSFMSHLLLDCHVDTVTVVVDTIVRKMNEAIPLSGPKDLSLLSDNIDWLKIKSFDLSEENVALLVGRRFVESAVRVLAMNHSRAGNTMATSQQSRPSESKSGDCVNCHMTVTCSTDNRGSDWTDTNTTQSSSRATGGQSSQRGALSKEFSQTLWYIRN